MTLKYKIPGPKDNRPTHGQMIKNLAHVTGNPGIFPDIRLPKPMISKAGLTPRPARASYKQTEAPLRSAIIKYLRKKGCQVWRVEPSFLGKFGLGDLWVICLKNKWAGWVEVKSAEGVLSKDQQEFKTFCDICLVEYIVVRNIIDTRPIYDTFGYRREKTN